MEALTRSYSKYCLLEVDETTDKATELRLLSVKRPHMRAFYVAMLSMFVGIFLWFSVAPLQTTIRDRVRGVTSRGVASAATCSVVGSMASRIVAGAACDKYGARRPMCGVLLIISVATGLTTLVRNDAGLAACRFFSGFGGSTLVVGTFWVSSMFSREIVGTATSIVMGIGYAGGGFGLALLGGLLPLLNRSMSEEVAWKVALLIPAVTGLPVAAMVIWLADDTPRGKHITRPRAQNEHGNNEAFWRKFLPKTVVQAASKPGTWILAVQYGCSAGTNTALLNVAPIYFQETLGASSRTASLISSSVGWLALTCFVGGYLSDRAKAKMGLRGRYYAQLANLAFEGVFLLIFSFAATVGGAAPLLVLCSLFATWATGTTFALVPYVDKGAVGSVAGIVGFVGSFGAVVLIQLANFFDLRGRTQTGFLGMSVLVLVSSAMSMLLRLTDDDAEDKGANAAFGDVDVEPQAHHSDPASAPVIDGTVPSIELSSGSGEEIRNATIESTSADPMRATTSE